MDFSFSEEQEAVRELADRIFTDLSTPERLREFEAEPDGDRFDRKLWGELAAAGLLGHRPPRGRGRGRTRLPGRPACWPRRPAAPRPTCPSSRPGVGGARPIAQFGTEDQRQTLAPRGGVRGDRPHDGPGRAGRCPGPAVRGGRARRATGGSSPAPRPASPRDVADAVLVTGPGGTATSVAVFIVETSAPGVGRERQIANTGQPEAVLDPRRPSGWVPGRCWARCEDGAAVIEWLVLAHARLPWPWPRPARRRPRWPWWPSTPRRVSSSASPSPPSRRWASGPPTPTSTPRPSGSPPGRPPGGSTEGLPADKEVAIAKFWAADGGQRVVHAAVHLHGGVGVDRDYPLHRYFLMTKHIELTLGGATEQLLQLGAIAGRRAGLTTGRVRPGPTAVADRPG